MIPRKKKLRLKFKGMSERQWRVIQFLKAEPHKQARWEKLRHLVPTHTFLDVMVKRKLLIAKGCSTYCLPSPKPRKRK